MAVLAAFLFGGVRLAIGTDGPDVSLQPTPRRLFAFLTVHRGRLLQRDSVAETLWPHQDPINARRCLNSTLFRLRQSIADAGAELPVRTPSSEEIILDQDDRMWIDLNEFEAGIDICTGMRPEDAADHIEGLEASVSHYRGALMVGIDDEWALHERRRVEGMYLELLNIALKAHKDLGNWDQAVRHGYQILDVDPLREDVHREVMSALMARGDRTQAMRQYEQLKTLLWQELEVSPMEETEIVYDAICDAGNKVPITKSAPGKASARLAEVDDMRRRVRTMRRRISLLQLASKKIQQDFSEVERLFDEIADWANAPDSK